MALPVFTYNFSTGSDTAASGAGPATAVTGAAGASTGADTGGVPSTTIILNGSPDLSGVATDGSHAIWIDDTAGNRHLSKITAKVASTSVTVEDSFNIANASAKAWAIGGKRKTFSNDTSNTDLSDLHSGWVWELEDTATFDLGATGIASGATGGADGFVIIRPASGHTPTINLNGSKRFLTSSAGSQYIIIEDIAFTNSGSWGGASPAYIASGNNVVIFRRNTVNGAGMGYGPNMTASGYMLIEGCTIYDVDAAAAGVSHGVIMGGRGTLTVRDNYIYGCDGDAVKCSQGSSYPSADIYRNILFDNVNGVNAGSPLDQDGPAVNISFNTIVGNTTTGILCTPSTVSIFPNLNIYANILSGNLTAINVAADVGYNASGSSNYNHFHNNTTDRTNWPVGANDTSGDPKFKNTGVGTEDFYLQATSPCIEAVPVGPSSLPTTTTMEQGALRYVNTGGGGGGATQLIDGGLIS